MDTYLVSKIKKITIKKGKEPLYLVKWYKSPEETWEPIQNFPDDINTYPGYKESLNNLWRVRNKKDKELINILLMFRKKSIVEI